MVIHTLCSQQRQPGCLVAFFWHTVFIHLLILIDYFNGCMRARSLDIADQIKLRENIYWYVQVCGLIAMLFFIDCL
jgi:hypothetical protein